jgi:ubiquinone/menaquinone biosynthesis C-methylase UbiE
MYKEYRAAAALTTASTPEMWADNFVASGRLGLRHRLAFRADHRWRLIQQHIRRGARILDAGCGAGEWVAFLNENGFDAEGLDYSEELIGRVGRMYPKYRWKLGTVQNMPYADGSMSAVISWGVIEHDEAGPAAALADFHRVLGPGGVTIVTVPIDSDRQRRASRAHFSHQTGTGERRP